VDVHSQDAAQELYLSRGRHGPVAMKNADMAAKHSSMSNEHYTPGVIVEAARTLMGGIQLDPASSALANTVVGAARFFDAASNGFAHRWNAKSVFLNPPGGKCDTEGRSLVKLPGKKAGYAYEDGSPCSKPARSSALLWWTKLATEWAEGRVEQAVFLGFSVEVLQQTQSAPIGVMDFPFCVPRRRIAFLVERDGKLWEGTSPPHANVIGWLPPIDQKYRSAGMLKEEEARFYDEGFVGCSSKDLAKAFGVIGRCR
jgi:hypothetical protein